MKPSTYVHLNNVYFAHYIHILVAYIFYMLSDSFSKNECNYKSVKWQIPTS